MRKLLLLCCFLSVPAFLSAACPTGPPQTGVYPGASGPAQYVVVMPPSTCYNGDVILFAHGYVPVGSPAGTWLSQLQLPDGTSIPALANSLGFGFAASSFSKDGLAILQGEQDTESLKTVIQGLGYGVHKYFAVGPSEGGLIATKLLENDSTISGATSVCGQIGSFAGEINYLGDVRVLFDYFFPGVLTTGTPGESAINVPLALILNWTSVYEPKVLNALKANPLATLQLLSVAKIPVGLDLSTIADAILETLTYDVFANNDAAATLGGNPFDNMLRTYHGSFNDAKLNAHVARFAASPTAIGNMAAYETTGKLYDALVTLHNIADPPRPYWQETLYKAKAQSQGSASKFAQIPVLSYGHCNVNANQAGAVLLLMVVRAGL